METVLWFEKKDEAKLKEILDAEPYCRGGYSIMDCGSLGFKREGNYLYFNHSEEIIAEFLEKAKDICKPVEEEKEVLKKLKEQEEAANAGMGMIFGE